ncbi:MAG: hypothetical protein LKE43_08600 [Olsenella sp.]|jgi:hypothetical protein|nr:hypothetical protein [Olsenella sp.]
MGRGARVHCEYVDVVARFGRDGSLEPVSVIWKDVRSFTIDEATEEGAFGAETRGRRQACYHVRFGGHETEFYLERRSAVPAMGAAR